MKKITLLICSLILVFTVTGCTGSKLESISYKDYNKMIDDEETFVLEVMSHECSHCESLKSKLVEVAKEYDIDVKVIDILALSDDEYKEFTNIIGTKSTPTIIFYDDGKEISTMTRIVGDVSKEKIIEKFKDNGYID